MFDAKQIYDKEVKITKAGKTFKMYDSIQEANVDTDIYEVAKKYGMEGSEKESAETYMAKNLSQISEEMQNYTDLRSVLDKKIAAQNMWQELPIDIRKQFNNDMNEFMDNGPEWIKNLIEKQKAEEAKIAETIKQTATTEVKNEQK